ncbi:UPF0488 protein CG14286-like isoform X2 [Ruditapes philippinarum]|uniref:UPF0488 protein CG14286-like isoform X2 n=1 Tax=Ruditapes philippinarum TaxID=129788 RepID=UPI00295AF5F0|nr:UPF0488 protein CG14286-like isoform X2 [Ruditapes philippinarum]
MLKPKPVKPDSSADNTSESDLPDNCEEMKAKFEQELIWCIEQLQLGLDTSNPNSKQAIEGTKALKILLSSKAPMIKKRQVMRNTFGDYRKKMAEMEHKSTIAARKGKITSAETKNMQKSTFFKKSTTRKSDNATPVKTYSDTHIENQSENCNNNNSHADTGADLNSKFQFNFKIDDSVPIVSDTESINTDNTVENVNSLGGAVLKSDNSFRFNFTIPS